MTAKATVTDEGYRVTDEWGTSLEIEHYTHKSGEERVQIYFDDTNEERRSLFEDEDARVDLPRELWETFCINYQ